MNVTTKTRYSRAETARLLDITERTVDRLIGEQRLDATRESGRVWVSAESVRRYLFTTWKQIPLPLDIPGVGHE